MSKQNALFSLLNWSNCQFKFSHKYTKLAMLSFLVHLESGYSLIWGAHRIWEQGGGFGYLYLYIL